MADRNWANEIKFVTYRSASEAATQQFNIVQKINDDTYLIAREKVDPDNEGGIVRLLYLRFRLFEANGSYAVVTQSVPQDRSLSGGSPEKIWANDVCMWNHFTPITDANGEEYCEIHLTGRHHRTSHRKAKFPGDSKTPRLIWKTVVTLQDDI
ncbi:hypothetical protein BBO99_00001328 [Phytophthora kernoviae]|uniref:Uncharacterized protein n=2 Tax=Phytophthora kernoviae TaxID=325452 RepID=A0A3R7J230_9STRA|nr:hypothetical protein G195_002315 [Phytophthora kernoviae 00238/432]KAG2529600.1 hypothetical protein JM16_001984 [Phytophthora kernoviae]KAG2530784.1 hypothetical protein JM18_001160 [Phytophthora kernoviae]RLN10270.1 hypothetical protein BBI17_001183 [Phytophthora kernoviae]RLN84402.1 hypothetical protein BBO99_00001328 [Phytophthora kernoviae]